MKWGIPINSGTLNLKFQTPIISFKSGMKSFTHFIFLTRVKVRKANFVSSLHSCRYDKKHSNLPRKLIQLMCIKIGAFFGIITWLKYLHMYVKLKPFKLEMNHLSLIKVLQLCIKYNCSKERVKQKHKAGCKTATWA